jgi:hypothetical protein
LPKRRCVTTPSNGHTSGPPPDPQQVDSGSEGTLLEQLARAEVSLEEARFRVRLLESQVLRVEQERARLAEEAKQLEATMQAIKTSKSWKLVAFFRRLVGRQW